MDRVVCPVLIGREPEVAELEDALLAANRGDGQIVLLTSLYEGQKATVLQLPAQPATAAEAKAQERVAHVG